MTPDTQNTEHPIRKHWRLDPSTSIPKVIGDEVRARGYCDLTRTEMARRAGVGKTTTDKWIQTLVDEGMITVEVRPPDRPSIIMITSRAWLDVLGRG